MSRSNQPERSRGQPNWCFAQRFNTAIGWCFLQHGDEAIIINKDQFLLTDLPKLLGMLPRIVDRSREEAEREKRKT